MYHGSDKHLMKVTGDNTWAGNGVKGSYWRVPLKCSVVSHGATSMKVLHSVKVSNNKGELEVEKGIIISN